MEIPYKFRAEDLIAEGRVSQGNVDAIKAWLITTKIPDLSEEMIILFLLSCESEIEATKNTICSYFKIKNEVPEIFDGRDVDENEGLKQALKTIASSSIPIRMDGNTVIHFFKLVDTNYANFDLYSVMKVAYMVIDVSQRNNPPNKLVVIIDMKGAGIMHLTRFKLNAVKKFLEFLQEAMPLKIQMVHILNANFLFDRFLALARAFIKSELMSILKSHPVGINMEEFCTKFVPAKCLPREYGGGLPSSDELNEITIQQFRELKIFFKAEENLRRARRV